MNFFLRNLIPAFFISILCALASSLFLWALETATHTRLTHPWLLYFLPIAGWITGFFYASHWARDIPAGTPLLVREIHEPLQRIPQRMAPSILVASVLTHLFGGSAGREGTAVQMGASIAETIGALFERQGIDRKVLVLLGLSAGFASIFGTPVSALVFSFEILDRHQSEMHSKRGTLLTALILSALCSAVAYLVTQILGVHHTKLPQVASLPPSFAILFSVCIAGVCFGVAALLFLECLQLATRSMRKMIPSLAWRGFAGGLTILLLATAWPSMAEHCLGIGVTSIQAAFQAPLAGVLSLGKIIFTTITLASGFKGGEVTPLFLLAPHWETH